jgi:hypothetical protein
VRGAELTYGLLVDGVGKRRLGFVGDLGHPSVAKRLDNLLTGVLHADHLLSVRKPAFYPA